MRRVCPSTSIIEKEIPSIWTMSLIILNRNPKGGKPKDEFDPRPINIQKARKRPPKGRQTLL
jgi:hypothetical protein